MMSGCKTLKVAGEVNENQDTENYVDTLATVSASEDDTTKSTIVSLQKTDTIAVDSVSKNDTDRFWALLSSTAISTDVRIVLPADADVPDNGNSTAILCASSVNVPYMFENGPCSRLDGRPTTVSSDTDQFASWVNLPAQPVKTKTEIK